MIRALHLVFYALSLNLVLCHFFFFMIYVGYTHIHVRLKISKIDAKKRLIGQNREGEGLR